MWYTPQEIDERLKLGPRVIQAMARRGEIPGARKFGKAWRFAAAQVDPWLNPTQPAPSAPPAHKLAALQKFRRV